jgi:hypothetical protein
MRCFRQLNAVSSFLFHYDSKALHLRVVSIYMVVLNA